MGINNNQNALTRDQMRSIITLLDWLSEMATMIGVGFAAIALSMRECEQIRNAALNEEKPLVWGEFLKSLEEKNAALAEKFSQLECLKFSAGKIWLRMESESQKTSFFLWKAALLRELKQHFGAPFKLTMKTERKF